jgi:hypothetical protein
LSLKIGHCKFFISGAHHGRHGERGVLAQINADEENGEMNKTKTPFTSRKLTAIVLDLFPSIVLADWAQSVNISDVPFSDFFA